MQGALFSFHVTVMAVPDVERPDVAATICCSHKRVHYCYLMLIALVAMDQLSNDCTSLFGLERNIIMHARLHVVEVSPNSCRSVIILVSGW